MKTLMMLLVSLAGFVLPVGLHAQEGGVTPSGRPAVRRFGFGVSVSSYSPDLSPLNSAFTDAEDQYRNQGYFIIPYSPHIEVARLVMFSLRFRPSSPIGVLLEAGTSLDHEKLDFNAVSASVLYFPPMAWGSVEPYLGAGIGHYRLFATRTYGEGNQIGPSSGGSYPYLDRIEAEGGGIGSTLTAGLDLKTPSSPFGLGAFVSYLAMLSSVRGVMPDGRNVELDLNTFMVGGRLLVNL
jgi:hypothetical protein